MKEKCALCVARWGDLTSYTKLMAFIRYSFSRELAIFPASFFLNSINKDVLITTRQKEAFWKRCRWHPGDNSSRVEYKVMRNKVAVTIQMSKNYITYCISFEPSNYRHEKASAGTDLELKHPRLWCSSPQTCSVFWLRASGAALYKIRAYWKSILPDSRWCIHRVTGGQDHDKTTESAVAQQIWGMFASLDIPWKVISENVLPFLSTEMKKLFSTNGITHCRCAPPSTE